MQAIQYRDTDTLTIPSYDRPVLGRGVCSDMHGSSVRARERSPTRAHSNHETAAHHAHHPPTRIHDALADGRRVNVSHASECVSENNGQFGFC